MGTDQEHATNYKQDSFRSPPLRASRQKQRRGQQSTQAVDDGLSMMTSALLNMLDTPEEAPRESLERELAPTSAAKPGNEIVSRQPIETVASRGAVDQYATRPTYLPQESGEHIDQDILCGLAMNGREVDTSYQDPRSTTGIGENGAWFPRWQGLDHMGRPLEENAQSMPVMQPRHAQNSPHTTSNIGLFLP